MSIILFATLSVPALGGAKSLRAATPRVPAFEELMGQMPTPPSCLHRIAAISPLYLHNPEPQSHAIIRCSPLPPAAAEGTEAQGNAYVPGHKLACS